MEEIDTQSHKDKVDRLREILTNPSKWPHYPFFSVSRKVSDPKKKIDSDQLGTLVVTEGKVYLQVLLASTLTVKRIATKGSKDELINLDYVTYDTIDEMVKNGWRA